MYVCMYVCVHITQKLYHFQCIYNAEYTAQNRISKLYILICAIIEIFMWIANFTASEWQYACINILFYGLATDSIKE